MRIDTGDENKYGFTMRTGDVQALTKLISASKENKKFARLAFNKEGLFMSELACDGAAWVYTSLKGKLIRSLQGEYKCDGPGIICFAADALYKTLSKQSARDEVSISYDAKGKKKKFPMLNGNYQVLKVQVMREEISGETEYEIPILNGDRTVHSSDTEHISFFAGISAEVLNSFIGVNLEDTIGTVVEISVSEALVEVEKRSSGGAALATSRLVCATAKGKEMGLDLTKRHVFPDTIKKKFYLTHLNVLSKFLEITSNGMIKIFMKEVAEGEDDYPIIFQVKVGGIGQVVLAISPKPDEEI